MSLTGLEKTKTKFTRNQASLYAYLMLSLFSLLSSMFGPSLPFLRDEFSMGYTVGGLHMTALAVGMIMTGLTGERLTRRLGRSRVLRIGGFGQAFGGLVLILGHHPAVTMIATLAMGYFGSLVVFLVQAILSDLHGENRATALTEANIGAAFTATLAPLLVGGFQQAGLSWRSAYLVGISAMMLLSSFYPKKDIPEPVSPSTGSLSDQNVRFRLPAVFWFLWLIIVLVIAIEWSLMVWGADYLVQAVEMSKENAALIMSLFFLATLVSRIIGSYLTRKAATLTLLTIFLLLSLVAFPILWLTSSLAWSVFGIILGGFGVSNLYPFAMSSALSAASGHANTASARISLGVGFSVFFTPVLLGAFAERLGIQNALGLIPILILGALLMVAATGRYTGRE